MAKLEKFIHITTPARYILGRRGIFFAVFFANKKNGLLKGYVAGVFGRFFFASLSGVIFYTVYVESLSENIVAIWASLVYNMTYIVPEAVITIILISIPPVKSALAKMKEMALS